MEEQQVMVRAGALPGAIKELSLPVNSSIEDVLREADLNPEGYEIRRNGEMADMEAIIKTGDTIFLVRRIRGNI